MEGKVGGRISSSEYNGVGELEHVYISRRL